MKRCAIVCLLVLVATGASAQQLVNENLLVALPQGYKVGFTNQKGNQRITEMVPSNETVEDWTEMVTVQIFLGVKTRPEPFKGRIERGWLDACIDGQSKPVASSVENGYTTLIWLLTCPRNPKTGKPEITWFKAMQGNDSFYMVQKAFKFAPSQEQITRWMAYLKSVVVCDSRRPESPCPRTGS